MNQGFSLIELLVAMTILAAIVTMVLSTVVEGVSASKKISMKQDLIESLFYTVDSIKNDLTKCGMRLQEAIVKTGFNAISVSSNSFSIQTGINTSHLTTFCRKGENRIILEDPVNSKKRKKILIYDPTELTSEIAEIKRVDNDVLILSGNISNDYAEGTRIIFLKKISYKYDPKQKVLKKKVDSGYFQPMIERVTDFFVTYFPDSNSVLYRIEIGNREQVRGYIFLTNMTR